MKPYRLTKAMVIPAIGLWIMPILALGMGTLAQSEHTDEPGVQILTRGPVHEAFAEVYSSGVTAAIVITKTPYEPIVELPPDQRPEGLNVSWIPGYWCWDDDRTDFIWVSGVWRDLPPGRQWIPGYWAPVSGGSQWISGFWGDAAQNEVTYLPPPPAPLEVGPSSPIPAPGNVWTSGNWIWQQTRYAWQPGYWVVQQPEWVWSPAHYTWTPRGYIYVPGYWDHDLVHRGVMFAPVYYDQPVYARPSYYYSPSIIIDLAVIAASLFVNQRSNRYYYGDYYDHRYEERGYYPWYSSHVTSYGNDSLYAYYRSTQLLRDPNWDNYINDQFMYRREHIDARPPQTLALQINITNNNITNNVQLAGAAQQLIIGKSLSEMVQSNTSPLRFSRVAMEERKQIESRGKEVHKLQFERARIETSPEAVKKSVAALDKAEPLTLPLPASPVAARTTENARGVRTPPVPVAPKLQTPEESATPVKSERGEARTEIPKSDRKSEKVEDVKTESPKSERKPDKVEDVKTESPRYERKPDKVEDVKTESPRYETKPDKVEDVKTESPRYETKPDKVEDVKTESPRYERKPDKVEDVKTESPKSERKSEKVEDVKTESPKSERKPEKVEDVRTESPRYERKPEKVEDVKTESPRYERKPEKVEDVQTESPKSEKKPENVEKRTESPESSKKSESVESRTKSSVDTESKRSSTSKPSTKGRGTRNSR